MIYLASTSPRRAELLRQIGVEFSIHAIDIDESRQVDEAPEDYVCRMAKSKAQRAATEIAVRENRYAVLAADTTIDIDGDIIGKPADQSECCSILGLLSGRDHRVLTAVALATPAGVETRLSESQVRFRELSTREIESYCTESEPMDKAGAYAIQGKAAIFINHLEGSYSAVMGLPLFETDELLRTANIELK